jgi:hypothetical protein
MPDERAFVCPAYQDGVCHREHAADGDAHCPLFKCEHCRRRVPWCFGGSDDERCNDCSVFATITPPRTLRGHHAG